MIIYLPNAVPVRVKSVKGDTVTFELRDACHTYAFDELFAKALSGGYAVRISLVHYEGHADTHGQQKARKKRKDAGK